MNKIIIKSNKKCIYYVWLFLSIKEPFDGVVAFSFEILVFKNKIKIINYFSIFQEVSSDKYQFIREKFLKIKVKINRDQKANSCKSSC